VGSTASTPTTNLERWRVAARRTAASLPALQSLLLFLLTHDQRERHIVAQGRRSRTRAARYRVLASLPFKWPRFCSSDASLPE